MSLQSLLKSLSSLPIQSNVISIAQNSSGKFQTRISAHYQQFLKKILSSSNSLVNRGNSGQLLNPNFNILSANGIAPVTPLEGSDYEVIKQWFVVNGGGINDYTLTPTPYSSIQTDGDQSNNYLNIQITDQDSPLYLYNLNYSQAGQFNSVANINQKPLAFSWSMMNNADSLASMQFSLAFSTGDEIKTPMVFIPPGYYSTSLILPPVDLNGISYSSADFVQPRVYFSQVQGNPVDLSVSYLKAELSDLASPLIVNPVLESYLCANLT